MTEASRIPTSLQEEHPPSFSVSLLLEDDFVVADTRETVEQVLARLQSSGTLENIVGICDDGHFIGTLTTGDLLGASPANLVSSLPIKEIRSVDQRTDVEAAAWDAAQAHAKALAVVDSTGGLVGILPTHRLLPVLAREHESDMARLGGFLQGTSRARTASEEPLTRRVWHRAPWLLIGLMGAVVSAQIVHSFEGKLENQVSLAFFLPGIIYMADAVGTQTETLVIRGLSVGTSVRRILRLELLTGAIVGVLLSVSLLPFAVWLTGDTTVAAIVSLSLMAATSCATVIAMSLPWMLQRAGFDPAFGSGPLATVIQDLLSLVLYFAIATVLLS